MMDDNQSLFIPKWNIPENVRAVITTRLGGVSKAPYDSLNLSSHVDDQEDAVIANRTKLVAHIGLPLTWLSQVHGTDLVRLPDAGHNVNADGCWAEQDKIVCSVSTADCLPILMCDKSGKTVSAVHAGWRGLATGMIRKAVSIFDCRPDNLLVYIGPAISQEYFQVGRDVFDAFSEYWRSEAYGPVDAYFKSDINNEGKYRADLKALCEMELRLLGVKAITSSIYCTWRDNNQFYSYRREGRTGRFVSSIWRI